MKGKNAVLKMVGICRYYHTGESRENVVKAVDKVNLEIKEGESVAIGGPSGSGKSTMLHLLGALDKPTKGELHIDGVRISRLDEDQLARIRAKKIGFVFQAFFLIPTMTVLENVMLPALLIDIGREEARRKAAHFLKRVNLERWAHHKATELSGGQKQRVAIARALINDPAIILADEPTGNLDTKTGNDIMRLFDELNGEGKTIITVTHDADIITHASRVVRLRDGVIVKDLKR